MKKVIAVLFLCSILFLPLSIKAENGFYETYQNDVDIVRMNHFDYYARLLDQYYQKTHSYPLKEIADQKGVPVYVFIMNDTQRSKFRDNNPHAHVEGQQTDFFHDLETKLGVKVSPKYDPQNYASSDHRPTMYIYMITKDEVFFAVHLYNPNKFTKKVADHYYKIELSNADDLKHGFYTYKTLQSDPEYKRLTTQEPANKKYFNLREQGKI